MKKFLLCLILSLQILVLTACQQEITNIPIESMATQTWIVDNTFTIKIPEDYTETSSKYIETYYKKDNSASIMVTVDNNVSQYSNIEDYYKSIVSQYVNTFNDFTEISAEIVTVNNKYNSKLVEFSYSIQSDTTTMNMSCYVEYILLGNCVYIVTCSAPTESYQDYREGFVQSVNSIQINR